MVIMSDIIVCDIGAHSIKLGFAGEEEPSLLVPCVFGTPLGDSKEDLYLGDDALDNRDQVCNLSYVFGFARDGTFVLKAPAKLEALLQMALTQLVGLETGSSFSDYKLFLARPAHMNHADLDKLLKLFFHTLKFLAVTVFSEAALVLKAHHQETGLVVEAGEGSTRLTPFFSGHPALQGGGSKVFPIAGRALTRELVKGLCQQGHFQYNPHRDFDLLLAEESKESFCYAAPCYQEEMNCAKITTLLLEQTRLLDGNVVDMERERFEPVESLFDPAMIGTKQTKGLPAVIGELVTHGVDVSCRTAIYENVLLSGSTGQIPGLAERLERDLRTHCVAEGMLTEERSLRIRVCVAEKEYAVFCGASATAVYIGEKRPYWVTQSEFAQVGAKGLLDKCHV